MLYSFKTRYRGITGASAWVVKFLVPVLFIAYGIDGFECCRFVFGLLFLYSLYEIGYIQNDCETVKRETTPTLRISPDDMAFYEKHKRFVYFVRLFQTVLWGSVLLFVCRTQVWLLFYGLLTLPVFLFYNHLRNGFCLAVHLLLMLLRYSVPVFLSANIFNGVALVFILFVYPLTLFIERSVKGKFGYRNHFFVKLFMHDYADRYAFRVKYYVAMLLLTAAAVCMSLLPIVYVAPVLLLLFTSILNARCGRLRYDK